LAAINAFMFPWYQTPTTISTFISAGNPVNDKLHAVFVVPLKNLGKNSFSLTLNWPPHSLYIVQMVYAVELKEMPEFTVLRLIPKFPFRGSNVGIVELIEMLTPG